MWWRRAEEELRAAQILAANAFPLQAYLHAGQAVEFALEAIYMRRRGLALIPEECRGARWHDLRFVAEQAGLGGDLVRLQRAPGGLKRWLRVVEWDSNGRFPGRSPRRRDLDEVYEAATREPDGVMAWLGTIFHET